MNNEIGVRFEKRNDDVCLSLVGAKQPHKIWAKKLLSELKLHYIDVGQNDKVSFYGNEEYDLCLRFIDVEVDDEFLLELTDVYRYPIFYEKSKEEYNQDLIRYAAFPIAIQKEIDSLLGTGKSISDDEYANCQIEAYKKLRNDGRLK